MKTYNVKGMTCDHCVKAVSGELSKIPGVAAIQVDLDAGTVTVEGEGFTDQQIIEGIDEAGFDVIND